MIAHVVMWKLKDPAQAPAFREALERCRDLVPGMTEFQVGTRADGLEASCDVVLLSRFVDAAALDAYQTHPLHREVGAGLAELREERHVLDFEY